MSPKSPEPPLALAVPPSRLAARVGGGYVSRLIMRIATIILASFCFIGCSSHNPSETSQRENRFIDRVSLEDAERAKERFHELKPGMTSQKVFSALGLSPTNMLCSGSGGRSCYCSVYTLRSGCGLWLFRNYTTNSDGILIRAIINVGGQEQAVGTLP